MIGRKGDEEREQGGEIMREREVMESVGEMMGSRMFSWNLAVAL